MTHEEMMLIARHLNLFFAPVMFILATKDYIKGHGNKAAWNFTLGVLNLLIGMGYV